MRQRSAKQQEILQGLASYVLEHGIETVSLRPMAKAIGTSDRMLLYHFKSKDQLISELLKHLAEDFAQTLRAELSATPPKTSEACAHELLVQLRSPKLARFTIVWLDIVAAAARRKFAFKAVAHEIAEGFKGWIETRLPESEPEPRKAAAMILTFLEGALILDVIGHHRSVDVAFKRLSSSRLH